MAVEFADGSAGQLDLTVAVRGDFEEGFRVTGEYGSVNGRLYLPWYHKAGEVECFNVKDNVYRRPLGADAYITKPFSTREAMERIRQFLNEGETEGETEA